ncbi:bifunctional 3-(3-hydroxy-phenyl)propionate/3-hydroxycinnamic acid hydroxylase [Sphingomonas sp. AR_OL41]|uniref:bifunctional 3-(3-hydroxy-phenyl)propionate/3-hydroxycinnamic acid hydroxylase MhpA n=1 Tax=Sphingomonas sp. AR_OL41 TaxID=3042729 RepID=UPI00248059F0|nr:bifunctional 3-(3-hydroxy-phenyl)propionate/3-hydroxycinnamic acid hydroxylase [Sphingomonas sp. AR_OL41]MDH7972117.1 bifunctional 3-(3-hydroxy-phenyl)propionate/3-hydroxycinnamic acid hydroxylase [Sphingomonas sp. AR_OL41]
MIEMNFDCDVLIVGLGPVGAGLAAMLGQTGRKVIAVEPQLDIYPLPRAAHVDHEIMRVFQSLGIIDDILPHVRVAPNYEFRNAAGLPLLRFEREGITGISGWPLSYNLYQPGIEAALRKRLTDLASVETWFGAKFVGVDMQSNVGVECLIERDGRSKTVRSRFVVGCDGAWSPVREAAGIELDDYGFDEPWLVLDARVADESGFPPVNLQLCDPARPNTFVHMGPGRLRWEFMLKPDEDAATMLQPANVDRLLEPWRTHGRIDVERTAVYRFHGLVARAWRHGRLLIAGDAAHQMPPFMGQGLCSGLRDAANLAWKLDHAIDTDHLGLLDSYQQEREPHVRFVIERAIEMGRIVCTLDPRHAAARDAELLRNLRSGTSIQFPSLVGVTMQGSPAAGTIFPQPVDAFEGRLDDIVGPGALLFHLAAPPKVSVSHARVIDIATDLPLELGTAVGDWLQSFGVTAVLVRPDHYVFGTGDATSISLAWSEHFANLELAV